MPTPNQRTAAEARRERADIAGQLRGLLDAAGNNPLNESQQERYDELFKYQEELEATATRLERQEALDAELRASRGTIAARRDQPGADGDADGELGPAGERATFLGYTPAGATIFDRYEKDRHAEMRMQQQYGEGIFSDAMLVKTSTREYKSAFAKYIRGGMPSLTGTEQRTLQEGTDPSGGYLVPEDMLNRIISRDPAPTRVSGRVTAIPTTRDRVTAPRVVYTTDDIYTTGMRVTWTGEAPSSATVHRVTDPVFGELAIDVHTAMMSLPVTRDFVEDAAFPIISWITTKFGETVDLLRDNMTLSGTGVGQPHGILESPGATNEPGRTPSGSASTIIADGLQDIVWDVPEQYEDNSVWVFNKNSTGKLIAKMKDTSNRYLWAPYEQSGLTGSRRADLLGYPVVFSAFMPNVSATTYPIIFGDLRGYYRVDRVGMSVQVLNELYAESNQVLLLGRIRMGGDVAEGYRLRIQQVSAS